MSQSTVRYLAGAIIALLMIGLYKATNDAAFPIICLLSLIYSEVPNK